MKYFHFDMSIEQNARIWLIIGVTFNNFTRLNKLQHLIWADTALKHACKRMLRIIPAQATLVSRGIVIGGLVEHLGRTGQRQEAVGKTGWHPEDLPVRG